MAETEFVPFAAWSVVTFVIIAVTGFAYKAYSRRKRNEASSS